jgi:hypothetical protein
MKRAFLVLFAVFLALVPSLLFFAEYGHDDVAPPYNAGIPTFTCLDGTLYGSFSAEKLHYCSTFVHFLDIGL